MKKVILLSLLTMSVLSMSAQVTIGSQEVPNEGTLLDLKEYVSEADKKEQINARKGLGLPRVKLQNLDRLEPCATTTAENKISHKGLVVYHVGISTMPEGEYYWDGENWNRHIAVADVNPDDGQFLQYDAASQSAKWTTIVIPTPNKGDLYQYWSTVANDRNGVDLPSRYYSDANPYPEYMLWDSDWKILEGLSISLVVPNKSIDKSSTVFNRLAIDFQTGIQTSPSQGWISYAIGVFLKLEGESNFKLRLVRTAVMGNPFGSGYPFDTYTLIGAIDNLPPGNHRLIVAARRRNQQSNNYVLSVGKKYDGADNTSNFQLQSTLKATLYLQDN